MTLVLGPSGDGKSTMIDAICFGLYGKPFRGINKPLLVNSINSKHLLVTIEFETKGKSFKIVRGIAPGIFEIWSNGVMMNQDSASRDYQQILENQILGMNFKTFLQISIIGSTAYTPFMKMKSSDRRAVIEDVLDISIFSVMNNLNKARLQENKDSLIFLDNNFMNMKTKADGCQKIISLLSDKHNNELEEIRKHIETLIEEKLLIETNIDTHKNKIDELQSLLTKSDVTRNGLKQIDEKISICKTNRKHIVRDLQFFESKDTCPTCSRTMEELFKERMIEILTEKDNDITSTLKELEKIKDKIQIKIEEFEKIENEIENHNKSKLTLSTNVSILNKNIKCETLKLKDKSLLTEDITKTREELKEVAREILLTIEQRRTLIKEKGIQEVASMLLKDTGIKTSIINEYLPLINKLLNKFLTDLELFVDFHLDENFNESIRSRYRDKFSYHNFSEGERLRIDMSIMFAWRQIARLKNSAATNILILDEVLVGRLDPSDTDIMINLLRNISREGTNIISIAHSQELTEKFGRTLVFAKKGNFSTMTEII